MRKFLNVNTSLFVNYLTKKNRSYFLISIILLANFLLSCVILKPYGKHEKHWAFAHPFVAIKLKKIKKNCDVIYSSVRSNDTLDKYENGGKLDAFRHMFYMASFANRVSPKKVHKLGLAHERDNYLSFLKHKNEDGEMPDSLSSVMDILNNGIGIDLAQSLPKSTNLNQIKSNCLLAIHNGNTFFMKRDSLGNYRTCDGVLINLNSYKNTWNVPKCLIQK